MTSSEYMSKWRQILSRWADVPEHRARVREAEDTIENALEASTRSYVAYSGGKDSTVLLHLVLQQKPDVLCLHWDYGPYYIPRDLEAEFINNARQIGATNIRVETSEKYETLRRHAVNVLGSDFLGGVIPRLKREGYDLAFVGLRAEESVKRENRIREGRYYGKIRECWPLASWSWRDVWAYIFSNGLPYSSVYDLYAPVVGLENCRLVTFFDPEFDRFGSGNVDSALLWRYRHDV